MMKDLLERLQVAYMTNRWIRMAAPAVLILSAILLLWISGGFPPWAWRFLFQVMPQIPRLWARKYRKKDKRKDEGPNRTVTGGEHDQEVDKKGCPRRTDPECHPSVMDIGWFSSLGLALPVPGDAANTAFVGSPWAVHSSSTVQFSAALSYFAGCMGRAYTAEHTPDSRVVAGTPGTPAVQRRLA